MISQFEKKIKHTPLKLVHLSLISNLSQLWTTFVMLAYHSILTTSAVLLSAEPSSMGRTALHISHLAFFVKFLKLLKVHARHTHGPRLEILDADFGWVV